MDLRRTTWMTALGAIAAAFFVAASGGAIESAPGTEIASACAEHAATAGAETLRVHWAFQLR